MTGSTAIASGRVSLADGMANVAAGLGAVNQKTQHTYMSHSDPAMLESSYRGSSWFGKIVDIPAEDSVKKWRQWNAKADEIEKIEATEKRLQLKTKVRDALILKRLHGGSVLLPTGLPGRPEKELRVESIRQDSLKGLTMLSRYQIQTEGLVQDIESPYFGGPEFYVINNATGTVRIHPSRVIRFSGRRFTHQNITDDGWGDSIWLRMADAIQNSETGGAALTQLLVEAKIDIISMPDLVANMATDADEARLMRRMTIATQLKSVANTLILDKDDEFTQKVINFGSIPDAVMTLLQIMCGVADIPMTRLIGTQAKGLGNGGDIDLVNYYANVNARQELDLEPALTPLDRMLIMDAVGAIDPSTWYSWRSLTEMTDKEKSEVEERYAKTAETLVNTGLFPADALQAAVHGRMIDSGAWPSFEQAIEKSKMEAKELIEGERGYEPSEAEQAALAARANPANGNDPEEEQPPARRAANDATPRTLYVHRKLLNADAVLSWAAEAGITDLMDAEKLHVTIAFSKQMVDWMKTGEDWNSTEDGKLRVAPGGVRLVEALGDNGEAVVLMFNSSHLAWRHEQIKAAGASWDHEDYQPHITVAWNGTKGLDLRSLQAYQGELLFGPEVFAEIDPDWKAKV